MALRAAGSHLPLLAQGVSSSCCPYLHIVRLHCLLNNHLDEFKTGPSRKVLEGNENSAWPGKTVQVKRVSLVGSLRRGEESQHSPRS